MYQRSDRFALRHGEHGETALFWMEAYACVEAHGEAANTSVV